MGRKAIGAIASGALVAMLALPGTVGAAQPASSRFHQIAPSSLDNTAKIDTSLLAIANPEKQTKVVVEMAAAPVAIRQHDALAAGTKLTDAQRASLRSQLKSGQAGLVTRLRGLGGRILGQYQDAYDGIKVMIAASRIRSVAALPGVVAVHAVHVYTQANVNGVPYIGAPTAWGDYGYTGAGVKIGFIDTGIDYTHANFGGPGTTAAYEDNDPTTLADGGFPTVKVAGGTDFVGDDYDAEPTDATYQPIPHPDPDPLDCNGHGSHTAGTAAGYGVLANGTTYTGPYNVSTVSSHSWNIGPGVAPQATLYAYKVFGCTGSTDVVVDAINQAVEDGMDVINMSLGSPFGSDTDPDAVAADNAALAGVVVVASGGNESPSAQTVGTPSVANRALSVAAMDASYVEEGSIDVGAGLAGQFDPALRGTLPITGVVNDVLTSPSALSLGCSSSDLSGVTTGQIAVVSRGTCTFQQKGQNAQDAGAAALIVVNNQPGGTFLPGGVDTLSIPVFIFDQSYGPTLIDANGESHTITDVTVKSPTYQQQADYSSGGPRTYDNVLKPEVSAPGNNIISTAVGTGTKGTTYEGTSMASAFTSGAAALVVQAHPRWSVQAVKAALIDTANATSSVPGGIVNYDVRTAGSGVIDAAKATRTVAFATTNGGLDTLSFGYEQLSSGYSETKTITLWNSSRQAIEYKLAASFDGAELGDLGASVSVYPSVAWVPAHGHRTVTVRISLSRSDVAALPSVDGSVTPQNAQVSIAGEVVATPFHGGDGRYALRVPFLVAPRGLSGVVASARAHLTGSDGTASGEVKLWNQGIHAGNADVYAWGIDDPKEGYSGNDLRAVGVQSFPDGSGDALMVFAMNTWGRWGNASQNEYDIAIDTNRDGTPDYFVVGYDVGALTSGTGEPDGELASFIFDSSFNLIDIWSTNAPVNGSMVELPVLASDLGLTSGASSFDYTADIVSELDGSEDDATGVGHFDALQPAISQGDFLTLAPHGHATLPVSVDKAGFKAGNTALGWMIVTLDDRNGSGQANLVQIGSHH